MSLTRINIGKCNSLHRFYHRYHKYVTPMPRRLPKSTIGWYNLDKDRKNATKFIASSQVESSPLADEVVYPKIYDTDRKAAKVRVAESFGDELRRIKTVEEKTIKLNMPRYYGWKTWIFDEGHIRYDSGGLHQHMTKTHVASVDGLPDVYDQLVIGPEKLEEMVNLVREDVKDAVVMEMQMHPEVFDKSRDDNLSEAREDKEARGRERTKLITSQVNRILTLKLAEHFPHLREIHVDHEPRLETSWHIGDMDPPRRTIRLRKGLKRFEDDRLYEPIDRVFMYRGKPVMHLRHEQSLLPFMTLEDSKNPLLEVKDFRMDPVVLGYSNKEYRRFVNIPGFWTGDGAEFSFLSYHDRAYLTCSSSRARDAEEFLLSQAIMANFGWLSSLAFIQGFSTYNDPTYPFVSQSITTDGETWSFAAYQLNTTEFYEDKMSTNPRRNVCWMTKPLRLYEAIEGDKVHGFNDEVIRNLVKLYANKPTQRLDIEDQKPYLGKTFQSSSGYDWEEKRQWLDMQHRFLTSNRLRHLQIPVVKDWQWIYKINHNMCHMWKKMDPWEKDGFVRDKRRLDEHPGLYIPKYLRRDPKIRRGKNTRQFYPEPEEEE